MSPVLSLVDVERVAVNFYICDPKFQRSRHGGTCAAWFESTRSGFGSVARRALNRLEAATHLDDLRAPPGNRLEALTGKRRGQYTIRINGQFRICFVWKEDGAYEVEIVDYH
jgi:proteic killer suppression protein